MRLSHQEWGPQRETVWQFLGLPKPLAKGSGGGLPWQEVWLGGSWGHTGEAEAPVGLVLLLRLWLKAVLSQCKRPKDITAFPDSGGGGSRGVSPPV